MAAPCFGTADGHLAGCRSVTPKAARTSPPARPNAAGTTAWPNAPVRAGRAE